MKQMTFADAEYAGKRKQTRKELFLIEMDRVVQWKGLIALIEPHYPKGEGGCPSYPLMAPIRHKRQGLARSPCRNQAVFSNMAFKAACGSALRWYSDSHV
ncbi:hypothetical protein LT18_00613 [Pseudomonas aeruginosa]|nr:hypothetical protein LT18_00613 [Pseudomonas aeruginosa]